MKPAPPVMTVRRPPRRDDAVEPGGLCLPMLIWLPPGRCRGPPKRAYADVGSAPRDSSLPAGEPDGPGYAPAAGENAHWPQSPDDGLPGDGRGSRQPVG